MKTVAFFASTLLVAIGLTGCGGGGGTPQQSNTPSVSISSSNRTPTEGEQITLTWTSANATSCNAGGSWSGALTTSGSQIVQVNAAGSNEYTITCTGEGGSQSSILTVQSTESLPFATQAILLPDLRAKYNLLCGNAGNVQSSAAANLTGHKDGRKDLLFTIWCNVTTGIYSTAPTLNGLVALIQRADGSFYDGTRQLFGVDLVDMAGGVAGRPVVSDFNGDGLDDVAYGVTGEDGRTLVDTKSNRQNVLLMSKGDGTYSVTPFGWPGYNGHAQGVPNARGGLDVLTSSIGMGGKAQAFRFDQGTWGEVSDYVDLANFFGSFFASSNSLLGIDRAIVPEGTTGLQLFERLATSTWTPRGTWTLDNVRWANYVSWNGDPGTVLVFSKNGVDYSFPSFIDHCRLKTAIGEQPISIFASPASEVTGGYDGRLLRESSPDFKWHLLLYGFSESQGRLTEVPLNFTNEITDQSMLYLRCPDVNGDGLEDIMVFTWGVNVKPIIYINNGNGNFTAVKQSRLPTPSSSYVLTSYLYEDVDGDGIADLIAYPLVGVQEGTTQIQYQVFKGNRLLRSTDVQ